ncbi:MAG TPA: glycosyltransferase family 39 protein [Chloroflexia bacterium]|nr:glycosyltransferase family 39 protein [Chloroflexia bacterium]
MQAMPASEPPAPAALSRVVPFTILEPPAVEPAGLHGRDLRNLGLIVLGFVAVLLVLPPQHEYPIIDDWIYYGSVQNQLTTGAFHMPDETQANLFGLTIWGTLWARVLGLSYTTLTYSTLALALVGLLAFYAVARAVEVPPSGALLGTVLLGLNPLFLHLSYSFMTDVPFLALLLLASYGYIRGLQSGRLGWLLVAGLFVGWAYVIRQFAVLVPAGFVAYLVLDAIRARRLPWREMLGILVVPLLAVAAWWLWTHDWPPTSQVVGANAHRDAFVMKEPWLRVTLLRSLAVLPLAALSTWVAFPLRWTRWWLVLLWGGVVAWSWPAIIGLQELWIATLEDPGAITLGPLTVQLPPQVYTFAGLGNMLRVGGIDFFEYTQQPLWTPDTWRWIFFLATVLGVLLLAKLSDGLLDGAWAALRGRTMTPRAGVYLAGLAVFVVSMAAAGEYYDRYLLGFLPFLLLFAVRGAATWGRWAWRYSIVACILWAGVSVLLKADAIDHDNARWQAGNWFAARGLPAHGGFDWDRTHGASEVYQFADTPIPGFRVEARFPYVSRLSGGETRYVYAQARDDQPPIPAAPP